MCTVAHTTILPPVTRVTCRSWHSTCHLFREGWFLSPIRLWQGQEASCAFFHLCNSFLLKALAGQSLADILKSQLLRRLRLTSVRPSWARLCKATLSCVESLVWYEVLAPGQPHIPFIPAPTVSSGSLQMLEAQECPVICAAEPKTSS